MCERNYKGIKIKRRLYCIRVLEDKLLKVLNNVLIKGLHTVIQKGLYKELHKIKGETK